jgi:uncharacterized protein YndB with AHSA1/START domain
MELRVETDYPAAPEAVFALLRDKAFRAAVCEATHAITHTVEVEATGEHVVVRTTQVLPAIIPDFVKKMVGETLEVEQTERWEPAQASGAHSGAVSVKVTGQPAGMEGTRKLEASVNGTRGSVFGQVSVKVPFFGARIEPEIAAALKAAIDKEGEVARAWLAGRR